MADTPQTALVEFQIRAENVTMDEWLAEWDIRARDAFDAEPETTAYAAAVNVDEPDSVLIFERYARGDASLQAHMQRPAHEALHATMGERGMTKRRVFSTLCEDVPDLGWWAREDSGLANAEGNVIVLLGLHFETPEQLAFFLSTSAEHAAYCWNNEPETLAYGGALAMRDADRGVDLKAGDLVWAMTCTDMAAVDKHANDPAHLALGPKFADAGIAVEPVFLKTYRTTGHGFLWRD